MIQQRTIYFLTLIFCSLGYTIIASNTIIGIDQSGSLWLRKGISSSQLFGTVWEKNPPTIQWLSVPGGVKSVIMNNKESVWALNQNGDIFIKLSRDKLWEQVPGKATVISLNDDNTTLALDVDGIVYLRSNTSSVNPVGTQWKPISTTPKMSALVLASSFLWALDTTGQPYFSESLNLNQQTLTWSQITGKNFKSLYSNGLGHLWALDTSNNIYVRTKIGKENPVGSAWKKIDGKFTHIALTDEGAVFGIDPNFNAIFTRKPLDQGNLLGTKWDILEQPAWFKKTYPDATKFVISSNLVISLGNDVYVQFAVERIENQTKIFHASHIFSRVGIDHKNMSGTGWADAPETSLSISSDVSKISFENNKCYLQSDSEKKELAMPLPVPIGQDISKIYSFYINKSGTFLICLAQLEQGSTKLYGRTGLTLTNPFGVAWQEIDIIPQGLSGTFKGYTTAIKTTDDDQIWALLYYQEINKWILVRRIGISIANPYGTGWKQIQLPPNLTLTEPQFALVEGGLLITCTTPVGTSAPNPGIWFKRILVPDTDGDDFIEIFPLEFDTKKYEPGYQPKVFLSTSEDGTIIVGRLFVKKDLAGNFVSEILWYQSEGLNYSNPSKTLFKPIALPDDSIWSMVTTRNSLIWAVGQKGVYFRAGIVQPHIPGEWKPINQKMIVLGSQSLEIPPVISRILQSNFEKEKALRLKKEQKALTVPVIPMQNVQTKKVKKKAQSKMPATSSMNTQSMPATSSMNKQLMSGIKKLKVKK